MSTVIVDYDAGNIGNITRALDYLGVESCVSADPETVLRASRIVLPGGGAFEHGMHKLTHGGLADSIIEAAQKGTSILGICLGMQMLLTESEENGLCKGMDLISGRVTRFKSPTPGDRFKVPHYGWNSIKPTADRTAWNNTVLEDLQSGEYAYFVHSYFATTDSPEHTISTTQYGYDVFASSIVKDNVTGCQFHPELSSEAGIAILRRFVTRA